MGEEIAVRIKEISFHSRNGIARPNQAHFFSWQCISMSYMTLILIFRNSDEDVSAFSSSASLVANLLVGLLFQVTLTKVGSFADFGADQDGSQKVHYRSNQVCKNK